MSADLQELLEAKRKEWAKPTDLSESPPQKSTPAAPVARETAQSRSAQPSTVESVPVRAPGHTTDHAPSPASEGDRIAELLAELDTLPPHNSKLTKFIMRLEPHLANALNQFCTGDKKLTPEMFVEAVLLILGGDEDIEALIDTEANQALHPLLTDQRDALKDLITHIAQQRAERRSRAGVIRRTLSMAGVDVPK